MPSAGSVAVVTVSYRSVADLPGFLDSVAASTLEPVRTVVVDNRSELSDEVAEIVRGRGADLVALEGNLGYGGAVNAGVATLPADVDYVLVSNPDVRLDPHALAELVARLASAPHTGAVGPLVRDADGSVYPSARSIPSLRTGVGHALLVRVWPSNPWTRRYRQDHEDPTTARDVGWLSGSCLLLRRSAFEQVGGFDSEYFMYFEDVDLGYRLGRAGWASRFEPTAEVTHIGGTSTATARPQMVVAHHRSAERFISSKYLGPLLAPVRWAVRAGLRARARWLTRGTR